MAAHRRRPIVAQWMAMKATGKRTILDQSAIVAAGPDSPASTTPTTSAAEAETMAPTTDAISIERGLTTARNFDGLGLPILSGTPEIVVELIENKEAPGGVGEIAVPPVAPALANALFAATGKRARSLPLRG